MIKWIKPNGLEIETGDNDAGIKLAKSLGWERAKKAKPANQSELKVKGRGSKDGNRSAGY